MQPDKILHKILTERISDDDAVYYDNRDLVYDLRKKVTAQDCLNLVNKCFDDTISTGVKCLYITLTRKYCTKQPISLVIKKLWEVADIQLKEGILWRLLDDQKLSEEWQEKIYDYVIENYDTYLRSSIISYYGAGQNGLHKVIESLNDNQFPESKKWIYVFSLVIYNEVDNKLIRSTIRNEMNKKNTLFTLKVCNNILKNILK
ncbi:MAG: hypothetical protein K9G47_08790 [Bacteroidales bacterium]|nr:hypothetical protein [Bacteroidales bacterium]MCF8387967.1 hypothetical protein [Bacteroidales bacterium]